MFVILNEESVKIKFIIVNSSIGRLLVFGKLNIFV